MKVDEFSNEMDRLRETFGDKAYPKPRVIQIYELVKAMSSWEFKSIVDYLIGNSKFAPLPAEIEKASREVKNKLAIDRKNRFLADSEDKNCPWCFRTGSIVARSLEDSTLYAFSCSCEFQDFYQHSYPKWNESLRSDFYPDYVDAKIADGDVPKEIRQQKDSD